MNSLIETGIIIAVVALSAVFVIRRVFKTFRSNRRSCCSDGAPNSSGKGVCPHCAKK